MLSDLLQSNAPLIDNGNVDCRLDAQSNPIHGDTKGHSNEGSQDLHAQLEAEQDAREAAEEEARVANVQLAAAEEEIHKLKQQIYQLSGSKKTSRPAPPNMVPPQPPGQKQKQRQAAPGAIPPPPAPAGAGAPPLPPPPPQSASPGPPMPGNADDDQVSVLGVLYNTCAGRIHKSTHLICLLLFRLRI